MFLILLQPDLPAEQKRIEATGSHDVQQSVEIVQGKRVKVPNILQYVTGSLVFLCRSLELMARWQLAGP